MTAAFGFRHGFKTLKWGAQPFILGGLTVTCYFRHLGEVFKKAGKEVTRENKHKLDKILHAAMNAEGKTCPETWKEVKKRLAEDETGFISQLKDAWRKQ